MIGGRGQKLFIIFLYICLVVLLYHLHESLQYPPVDHSTTLMYFVKESIPTFKHSSNNYITTNMFPLSAGAGLGNLLYNIASLYGIASTLGMRPFMQAKLAKQVESLKEEFPSFDPLLLNISSFYTVPFSPKCCTYDDVELLRNYTDRNVTLEGAYFQSYRYFDRIQPQIKEMLSFSSTTISTAKAIMNSTREEFYSRMANQTGTPEAAVSFCVHIRRGDFVNDPILLESRKEFTVEAVNYIREELHTKQMDSMILLIGNDKDWAESLFPNDLSVFISSCTPPCPRAVDLAILANECDVILLTASGSSFGFWGAYLSDKATVYYNEEYAKDKNNWYDQQVTPKDFFLSNWVPLKFNISTTTSTTTTSTMPTTNSTTTHFKENATSSSTTTLSTIT